MISYKISLFEVKCYASRGSLSRITKAPQIFFFFKFGISVQCSAILHRIYFQIVICENINAFSSKIFCNPHRSRGTVPLKECEAGSIGKLNSGENILHLLYPKQGLNLHTVGLVRNLKWSVTKWRRKVKVKCREN